MINELDKALVAALPQTEYGQAQFRCIRAEIEKLEQKEAVGGLKLCDDPIFEDLRFQLGLKAGLNMVLNMPDKFTKELRQQGQGG